MADTPQEFAAKLRKLSDRLSGRDVRVITERVARKAKPVAADAISPDTLSHWGRGGKRGGYHVKSRYDVKSDTVAALYPTIPPLAALLESGSGTTWRAPRRRGSTRRKRGTVGTYQRAAVRPRHVWTKAAETLRPVVPRWYDEEVARILRDIF